MKTMHCRQPSTHRNNLLQRGTPACLSSIHHSHHQHYSRGSHLTSSSPSIALQQAASLHQQQPAPSSRQHSRRRLLGPPPSAAVPDWDLDFEKNPQNTQNPQVVPSPSLSPVEAVRVQLEAISNNDTPWDNHGVQTMYEFADDAGSMERSRYFGFSKDLYHLDHFLGGFKTACGPLVDCQAFTLLQGPPDSPSKPLEPLPAGAEAVYVAVTDSKGADGGVFELRLVQREAGLKAGCWMTKSCLRVK